MQDPQAVLKARLMWVELYQQTGNLGLTCRRCGISAPTLRKWARRYQALGEEGLRSQSRRPHKLPQRKVLPEHERLILDMRRQRRLGPKGLQREIKRLHQIPFSTSTLWKVLARHGVSVLRPARRPKKKPRRYNRPVPGDRVQVDTCKIGKGLYQFTAIDDCTRMRVLGLYSDRSAANAVRFLQERLLKEFPFSLQRIQSDRGSEFIGPEFQDALREARIKFRPNRPAAPHLNGKVERSQRTDRMELWDILDLSLPRPELERQLEAWQSFYNQERTHSALGCHTPQQRLEETRALIPTHEAVAQSYGPYPQPYVTTNHYIWIKSEDT